MESLMEALRVYPLTGQRVLLQLYGQPAPGLVHFLRERGAVVEEILPYRHLCAPETGLARLLEKIHANEETAGAIT
ncbi:uroporphyrinogen-III synthase, partial [Thermus scotoductus]